MKRAGTTILETLIALTIGLVVLGAAVGLLLSVSRAGQAGELAGALQDAGLAMATIERDLLRALATPDGSPAVRLAAGEMKLAVGTFAPDGRITPALVRYAAAGGRLTRSDAAGSASLPGTYEAHRFELAGGPAGPYLRVTLQIAAAGPPAEPARAQPAVLSALFRLPPADLAGSRLYSLAFLDDVKAALGP